MRTPNSDSVPTSPQEAHTTREVWVPPSFEVICLACEISSYAPDGELPLF